MNIKQCLSIFLTLIVSSAAHCAQINTAALAASTAKIGAPTPKSIPTAAVASAPYTKELQTAKMTPAIVQGWQALYEKFLQSNAASSPSAALNTAQSSPPAHTVIPGLNGNQSPLNTLLETNFFTMMQNHLNPKTFPKLPNDPEAVLHTNYATKHLFDTAARLASITSINASSPVPTVTFSGDCRDRGIIVNIQNNTDAQFSISQTSLDGTQTMQIGQLNPGLNEVNLHTAALQNPSTLAAKGSTIGATAITSSYFEMSEIGTESSWFISVKMMTGAELLASLTPISTEKPNIFLMNGQETDSKYIATPNNFYLVLTNEPTASNTMNAQTIQAGKRVQALDITEFTGPFLMTLQINPVEVSIKNNPQQSNPITSTFNQPSMVSVQVLNPLTKQTKEKSQPIFNLPLIILPQFLWQNSTTKTPSILQAYWMLATTTHLAALTNFTFINKTNFGNSFEYFNGLQCFNEDKQCRVVIDSFAILKSGYNLYDAPWIIGSNLYEINLKSSPDIPQISSSQNSEDKIIANSENADLISCILSSTNENAKNNLINQYFGNIYQIPYNNRYFFTIPNPRNLKKFKTFAELKKINTSSFSLTIKSKSDFILFNNNFHNNIPIHTLQIDFLTNNKNWKGSSINLISTPNNHEQSVNKFEIEYQKSKGKFQLKISDFILKDKKIFKHVIEFTESPPIKNLYIEAYKQRDLLPYTTYPLITTDSSPSFLQNLTLNDWASGISFISVITSDKKLKTQNNLQITFYKKKQKIGSLLFKNITTPIEAYNLKSSNFDTAFDIYLTTEMILKYKSQE